MLRFPQERQGRQQLACSGFVGFVDLWQSYHPGYIIMTQTKTIAALFLMWNLTAVCSLTTNRCNGCAQYQMVSNKDDDKSATST
jgi:hypothetical protein